MEEILKWLLLVAVPALTGLLGRWWGYKAARADAQCETICSLAEGLISLCRSACSTAVEYYRFGNSRPREERIRAETDITGRIRQILLDVRDLHLRARLPTGDRVDRHFDLKTRASTLDLAATGGEFGTDFLPKPVDDPAVRAILDAGSALEGSLSNVRRLAERRQKRIPGAKSEKARTGD